MRIVFQIILLLLMAGCSSKPDIHRNIYFQRSWSRETVTPKYLGYRPPAMISPVLLGDSVISGNGVDGISAFNRKSGKVLWKLPIRNGAEGVFADSKSGVFLGGNNGKFYYLNPETGAVQWSYSLNSESTSAPLVQGNFIFHMAMNGAFYCMEKESGRVLWVKTRPPKDAITIRGTTQPVYADGKVFVGYSDGYFVAYNAVDGGIAWEKPLSDNKKFNDVDARPAITDSCIVVANYSDTLYCLDRATGATKWSLNEGGSSQPIQVSGNDIFYSTESAVMIVDLTSGKPRKRWNIDKKWGQPTAAFPYKNWIVFALSEGPVVLMDRDTGAWDDTFFTGRGVSAAPTVLENGEVFVVSNQANVYKLRIAPKDKMTMWVR